MHLNWNKKRNTFEVGIGDEDILIEKKLIIFFLLKYLNIYNLSFKISVVIIIIIKNEKNVALFWFKKEII